MKCFVLFFTLSFSVFAQELYYLNPQSLNLNSFPRAPELNSPEDMTDYQDVLLWQANRSGGDCLRAAASADGFATSFFGPPYGPLTKEEAEDLVVFQERLFKEVNFFARQIKERSARLRPYLRSSIIQPCIPLHNSASYPSGHAAVANLAARTFSLIHPERAEAIDRRGRQVGWDRVVGGVHYPSDVRRGRDLGNLVFEALMKEDRFLRDVEALRP